LGKYGNSVNRVQEIPLKSVADNEMSSFHLEMGNSVKLGNTPAFIGTLKKELKEKLEIPTRYCF
jgi:hypothetical protein